MAQKLLCFVLGAPGAGKGTQCERIQQSYGWSHISAGDLLRQEVASGSELAQEIQNIMAQGQMVPSSIIIGLLSKAVESAGSSKVLIDGFPRKLHQLMEFEEQVRPCDHVFVFDVPEEEARRRLLARGASSGRVDDNAETIIKRFKVFSEESVPVINHLEASGRVTRMLSVGPPEEVFDQVKVVVEKLEARAATAALKARLADLKAPLVICGPSGVGKGTLIGRLMEDHGDAFGFSVSHTTRGPRPGEQQGVHYHFTSRTEMEAAIAAGGFLEHADVHGNMYGTSLSAVADVAAAGKVCVLDIDVQGAQQVKASAVGDRCLFVFVAPPSMEELERRLRGRGTEAEDKVLKRLAGAKGELEMSKEPGLFDLVIVNDDLDATYAQLKAAIQAHAPGTLPPSALAPTDAADAATASLLDFGFGAAVPTGCKGLPVRQYMDSAVVPVLREGLKALNLERPDDPLQFLADFLVMHKAQAASLST